MRQFLVLGHRWAGLITAVFIAIAGLTGSVIAYEDELESWLNPHLFAVSAPVDAAGRAREMLDPFELQQRVARALPDYYINTVKFHRKPDQSLRVFLQPRPGVAADKDEAFVDPYTGEVLGLRKYGATPFARATLIGFIYELHHSLAIPGVWGRWLFGAIAIVWTLDCFMGLALTFPRGRPFWQKWSIAWKIKRGAAPVRLNLDLHRAFGLWLWALLLLYAWSSVMLNLRQQVYRPVMSTVFEFTERLDAPRLAKPLDQPALDWRAAAEAGRAAMRRLASDKHFDIYYEDNVGYNRNTGVYSFSANTSRDIVRDRGQTLVYIDGNTGAMLASRIQTGEAAGDTVSRWLQSLHMRQIWGRPFQLFVCLMGLVAAMLSITGVIIWGNKRAARNRASEKTRVELLPFPASPSEYQRQ